MFNQTFVFNKTYKYNVKVCPSKIAIWEAYLPYINQRGIFSLYEREAYIASGSSLSSKLRNESLYNNLIQVINRFQTYQDKSFPIFKAAECGGGNFITTKLIATVLSKSTIKKKSLDVYDTFSGLPSSKYQPELNKLEGLFSGGIKKFRSKMSSFEFVKPIVGIVPASFNENDENMYDFVHIDLDLYEGTMGSIKHFFPKMKKFGIIQLDDYNSNPWQGVNDAIDNYLSEEDHESFIFNTIPMGGAYIVKL